MDLPVFVESFHYVLYQTRDSISLGYPIIERNAQWSIYDEIRGVCIAYEILFRVFDKSSQRKQILTSKRRSKIG